MLQVLAQIAHFRLAEEGGGSTYLENSLLWEEC
jgi:hypothetical protein